VPFKQLFEHGLGVVLPGRGGDCEVELDCNVLEKCENTSTDPSPLMN